MIAAIGDDSGDDVTITDNGQILAEDADIYAGDSIIVESAAQIVSPDADFYVATNYNDEEDTFVTGSTSGQLNLASNDLLPVDSFVNVFGRISINSSRFSNFLTYSDRSNYFNALQPVLEEAKIWNNIQFLGFLPEEFDYSVDPENSGSVEYDYKKK